MVLEVVERLQHQFDCLYPYGDRIILTSILVVLESYAAFATTIPTLVRSPEDQPRLVNGEHLPRGYGCKASMVACMIPRDTLLPYNSTKPKSEFIT